MKFPHFLHRTANFRDRARYSYRCVRRRGLSRLAGCAISEIAPPTVVVNRKLSWRHRETLAETVATPLEEAINGVENMLYMSSSSTGDGALTVTVTFAQGTDINEAQVLVQNRVSTALPRLPDEVRQIGVTVAKNSSPTSYWSRR